jgi:hypothetical protein
MSRVISSRSAAMVRTRNENHQGTTIAGRLPRACSRLPISQAAAPASSSAVCAARCRATTIVFTAMKASEAPTASHAAAAGIPASMSTPARADAAGAANASRSLTATARSIAITVPMKAQIMRKACADTARPGQALSSGTGTATPARSRPPMTPLASKAAASATNAQRPTRKDVGVPVCDRVCMAARGRITSP